MPSGPSRKPFAPYLALATLAALTFAITPGRGQPDAGAGARAQADKAPLKREFIPSATCANQCHDQPVGFQPEPGASKLFRLVLGSEYRTWNDSDKHRRAFDALRGERGMKIGELLKWDVTGKRECLSCHASGFEHDDPPAAEGSEAMRSRDMGVGCTSCHGPYREWVREHNNGINPNPEWRKLPPEVKGGPRFRLTNLRDPEIRAGVCSSCHVGNLDEGKIVTHAMYAAGHPPLPGIEIATFLKSMPAHWSEPSEIEAFQNDPELAKINHVNFAEPRATRTALVGGVVALRDAMRMLAARSKPDPLEPLGRTGKNWPDYAQLECYACHHDLRSHRVESQAPDRVPGRPQFRPWSLALARLALAQNDRAAFLKAVKNLDAAFDAQPFGLPSDVNKAAQELENLSTSMLDAIKGRTFEGSMVPTLLEALASTPKDEVRDYDSARQIAWAFKAIYADWKPVPANHVAFEKAIADLDKLLKLEPYARRESRKELIIADNERHEAEKLRDSGRERRKELIITEPPPEGALRKALLGLSEDEFKLSISHAADFDPGAFQNVLERLAGLLIKAKAANQAPQAAR